MLTDEQIAVIGKTTQQGVSPHEDTHAFARSIEAVVLAKLREGGVDADPVEQAATFMSFAAHAPSCNVAVTHDTLWLSELAEFRRRLLDYGDRRAAVSRDQTTKEMQNLIRGVAMNECAPGVARATAHRCIQVLEAAPKANNGD